MNIHSENRKASFESNLATFPMFSHFAVVRSHAGDVFGECVCVTFDVENAWKIYCFRQRSVEIMLIEIDAVTIFHAKNDTKMNIQCAFVRACKWSKLDY